MSKDLSIANNNDIEITSPPSLLRKTIASIALYSYVLSFVVSPVYATTTEVIPSAPSFHCHYYESDVDNIEEDFKDVSGNCAPIEPPLQQQFRLWNSLPPLLHKPLPFDEVYQPAGWNSHYQVSFGFEDTHSQGVLNIPSSKDFVNLAGAQWLRNIYGPLGWHCYLEADKFEADKSALSFSYRPQGRDETIAFTLNYRGHVRLSALNAKGGIFYTTGALSLAFTDDTVIPPQLIVAAPIIRNETELTADHLQLFAQEHINRGGYKLEQGEINAHHTENHQAINITKSFSVSGYSWKNLADITGNGAIALHLQGALDNRSKTIRSTDHLTLLAESINNENGTLEGKNFVLHLQRDLNNDHGKVLSEERVDFRAANFFSHTGLIRSLEGLDLRNVEHADIGGIESQGDVLLKEGHFTLTSASAMGNPEAKIQHKINRLVIERNPVSPRTVMELLGTIKAKFFQALKSTVLGKDVEIEEIVASPGSSLTFTPGQIKRLTTRMKDNPLTPELIQDLERLEWLLEDETNVLPYDVHTAGQLIIRPVPGAVIAQWPITRNARAFKGLELHLRDSDVIMGDGEGKTYPEWIADTGPLLWYLNSLDQKSGFIAARAGGNIATQGKLKLGETGGHKYVYSPKNSGFRGDFYSLSNRSATVYSNAPLLISSVAEDIITLFLHVEGKDLTFRTPKNIHVLSSLLEGEGVWNIEAQHLLFSPDNQYLKLAHSFFSFRGHVIRHDTNYIQHINRSGPKLFFYEEWFHLAKEYSKLNLEGTLNLNLANGYRFVGGKSYIKGKIGNINPSATQFFMQEKVCEDFFKCTFEYPTYQYQTADLSVGTSIDLPARTFSLDGALLRSPVIRIRTTNGRVVVSSEQCLQTRPVPKTLYDLRNVIRTGALTQENPDVDGPRTIPRFPRELPQALSPAVFLIPGQGLTLHPPAGTRLQFDPSLEAKAIPDALFNMGYGQGYLFPRMSSNEAYARMRLVAYAAYLNAEKEAPHLIAGSDRSLYAITNAQQTAENKGDLLSYVGGETARKLIDRPLILYGAYGSPVIYVPKSIAHRSLQSSMTGVLADDQATFTGLDGEHGSHFLLTGVVDGGRLTELLNDHTTVMRPMHTQTRYNSYKSKKKYITETITETLIGHGGIARGDDVVMKGITQSFTGHLEATNSYLIHGSESAEIGVAHETREVIRHEQKKNSYGKKKNKQSHEYSSTVIPSVLQVHNPAGKGTISSGQVVHMTSPHFAAVLTEIKARKAILEVGHNISGGSSVSTSTDPFVNRVKISSHHHDRAVAAKIDGKVLIDADEVTTQRPAGTTYPNLEIVPRAETTDQEIADIYQSYSDSQSSLGIVPIGALGLLGGLAGGQIFGAVFGTTAGAATGVAAAGTATTTAANLTAAQIISATTMAMAKAATCFMGSHLFQGLATGNFKVDIRGLGTTIAAAALIGSGPNLDAKATFMDNLATQVVHELKAAPTRMVINTTIGGERFEDAAISTLRQGASHAIGATLAHQLGQLYQGPDKLGYITHKLAHFASGALSGTIMANDPLGGAFGAAFAEVAMEAMVDAKAEATTIKQENPGLKEDELREKLHNRLMAKRFFSQVIGGFVGTIAGDGNFSVAASIAATALDYNMMPTLLDEACREYYGLTTEALDAREIERPLTPRTLAAIKAFNEYNELYQKLDEVQRENHRVQGFSAESYAANAYQGTERMLAENAVAKFATGQEITEYEREVISDFVDLGIDKTKSGVATVAITMAANVALKSVATRVPFAARLIAGKTLPVKVSQAVTTAKSAGMGMKVDSIWHKGPVVRGELIEKQLGQNLHQNFPVVDRFEHGIATSIKSLNLNAPTYQNTATLKRTITNYVDTVSKFEGASLMGDVVPSHSIRGRALDLAIPSGANVAQRAVLDEMRAYATTRGVKLSIIVTR